MNEPPRITSTPSGSGARDLAYHYQVAVEDANDDHIWYELVNPPVGMVIDTFHFHAGGSVLPDLDRVPIDRLFVVHLNGCEDLPKPELADAHRLYPGEGVIPIEEILSRLRARGFDGVASIEIFRPEYWEQDPRAVARTAKAKATEILTKVGYTIDG